MTLNRLVCLVAAACVFVAQTSHGTISKLLPKAASGGEPRDIPQTPKSNGFQTKSSLNMKRIHGGEELNISSSRYRSRDLYTGNKVNNPHGRNINFSTVSASRDDTTDNMISEKKYGSRKQESRFEAKERSIQVSRVDETTTTNENNQNSNTAQRLDKLYKRQKGRTKAETEAISTPGTASTLKIDPVQIYQDANARLKKFIFNQHNILHLLAPYNIKHNSSDITRGVLLKFTPIRILFLDEVQQSITVSCFMMVKWYDNSFTWDPLHFGNISETLIKSRKLWTPTIIMPTSTGHGLYLDTSDYLLVSPRQGPARTVLSMKFPFQFTVQCEFDMSRYPFDQQTCVIIFQELNQNPLSAVTTKETDFEMAKSLHTSGEWEIVEWHHLERDVEEPFTLRWRIRLRRQSQFYVANLLIPLVQTSLMTLLVFWIPAESGEKMSFVVSMFVSTSVFLFTINDEMPRSIRQLPIINILVVVVTSEIILVAVASLFVLRRCRYLQKVKSAKTSLAFESELEHIPRSEIVNCKQAQTAFSIRQITKHLTDTESPPEYVRGIYSGQSGNTSNINSKVFTTKGANSETLGQMAFKLNTSDTDNNHLKIWGHGLYSHETLDLIFFCIFVFINVIVGTVTYFSWF